MNLINLLMRKMIVFIFQLYSRLEATKLEIHDLKEEHVRERQELAQTQDELTRELKLKYAYKDTIILLHVIVYSLTPGIMVGWVGVRLPRSIGDHSCGPPRGQQVCHSL